MRPTSSRPTGVPSGAPSKAPSTSNPTQPGDTNPPTSHPTAAPSYDLDYQSHFTYENFLIARAGYVAVTNSFTFGTYFYKGLTPSGQCSDWSYYAGSTLQLPFDELQFSQLTAAFEKYDFASRAFVTKTAVCSDPVVVNGIVASLRYGTVFEGNCNDILWRVFNCNGKPVFCVNCKKICVATESCPGSRGLVVNPCATCKTHAAASAVVNVKYQFVKLYPQFNYRPQV